MIGTIHSVEVGSFARGPLLPAGHVVICGGRFCRRPWIWSIKEVPSEMTVRLISDWLVIYRDGIGFHAMRRDALKREMGP